MWSQINHNLTDLDSNELNQNQKEDPIASESEKPPHPVVC